jgi:RimJ/RimL family protein N-acetyltransferase
VFDTAQGAYAYGAGLLERAVHLSDGNVCAWTAIHDDGRILGTGGIVYFTGHSGEAWLHLSRDFPKYARHIIPKIKEQVDAVDLPRIQALTDVGFRRAERFIKYLGFEYEATLEKYGPDQVDQKMWKIIKE